MRHGRRASGRAESTASRDWPPYDPDFLINYELGWKTTFGPIRWNGAVYHQILAEVPVQLPRRKQPDGHPERPRRDGSMALRPTSITSAGGLTLNAAAAYTDAKTKGNICNFASANADCSGLDANGDPDFIAAPSGTRLPVTPKFKVTGNSALQLARWVRARRTSRAASSTKARAASALETDRRRRDQSQCLIGQAASPTPWSTCSPATTGDNYSIELFATNVFDKRNELSRFVVVQHAARASTVVPGRPRTIGMRAGLKF